MRPDQNIFEFDDLEIDCNNFRVRKAGRDVTVTPRAFDVLMLLVRNGGRVVEKQEIFDNVWKDTFVSDNALSKVVKEIRQALDDDAANPRYIETVPKRGYRLIAQVAISEPEPVAVRKNPVIDSQAAEAQRGRSIISNRSVFALLVLIIGLGTFAFYYFIQGKTSVESEATDVPIDSIAVLPFENAAQDPNADYLSEGMAESLINDLAQMSDLKVMSLGSVFHYEGKVPDPQRIGNDLNVRAVLTGSVRLVEDQIVVNVSLDDTRQGRHIWGEQYVRKFADVLTVQNDIEQNVLSNLRVKLLLPEQQPDAKRYTNDPEAYQLYLKGQYEWRKHTEDGLLTGIDYYKKALLEDPNYALAYVGLSASYGVLGNSYLRPDEAFPEAKNYAAKALEIDDRLADAHTAAAAASLYFDWNWQETARQLDAAQSLAPNLAESYNIRSDLLDAIGRLDESLASRKRAVDLDPLSPMYNCNLGITLYNSRRYDEAIPQLERTTDLEPTYVDAWTYLGLAYEQKKMYPQEIETLQKGMAKSERHPQLIAVLARAYAVAGDRDRSQRLLGELREAARHRYVSPYLFALVYEGMGDKNNAFASLQNAYEDHSYFMIWLNVAPEVDALREDPRFTDLVRRIGL